MIGSWALVLAFPARTFLTSKSYSAFMLIEPNEHYWATGFLVAFLLGVAGCWASFPGVTRSSWVGWLRIAAALILGVNHGMIGLLMFRSNPLGTGTGIYLIVMVGAYLLAAVEAHRGP